MRLLDKCARFLELKQKSWLLTGVADMISSHLLELLHKYNKPIAYFVPINKAQSLLGYSPQVTIEQGLELAMDCISRI